MVTGAISALWRKYYYAEGISLSNPLVADGASGRTDRPGETAEQAAVRELQGWQPGQDG